MSRSLPYHQNSTRAGWSSHSLGFYQKKATIALNFQGWAFYYQQRTNLNINNSEWQREGVVALPNIRNSRLLQHRKGRTINFDVGEQITVASKNH
jgi:hypothetical protein